MLRVTVASKSESTTRGMIKFAPTEFQAVETCVFVPMMWAHASLSVIDHLVLT